MKELLLQVTQVTNLALLGYFVLLNGTYLILIGLAVVDITRRSRRERAAEFDGLFGDPTTPGVSVVVPAFNEEAGIVDSVRALLALRHPDVEVVVVDDGSADATFERLRDAFDLVPSHRLLTAEVPVIGTPTGVFRAADGRQLVVVRKPNTGRRADALNVGINAARKPLVLMIDADSLLEHDALLRVVRPFVDDPVRTVAVGGVIRPVNGSVVERGRVTAVRMPASRLASVQVVEYLRSFLFARTAWSRLGALLVISGAFGLFRRDVLVEVGGVDLDCIGEDAELVTRIHRRMREQRRPYRVAFLPDPVCWTEVPQTLAVLGRQRRRWSRGLGEVLWTHRRMMLNPRYGAVGLLAMPYFLVFELLSPVVEVFATVIGIGGLAFGLLDVPLAALIAVAALGYGVLLSVAAVAAEELTHHRYPRWRDLGRGLTATVVENIGFRQVHTWWRLAGLWSLLTGRRMVWGAMERRGFDAT